MPDPTSPRPSVMVQPYAVDELSALREAVHRKFHNGSYLPTRELMELLGIRHLTGRSATAAEAATTIEEQTRTHMLAGHTAEMLIEDERRWRDRPGR